MNYEILDGPSFGAEWPLGPVRSHREALLERIAPREIEYVKSLSYPSPFKKFALFEVIPLEYVRYFIRDTLLFVRDV